jgi:hypothetical protein
LKERGDSAFAEALASRAADPVLGARVVDVRAVYDGTSFRVTLTDQGRGFDVARILSAAEEPDLQLASGRGILIMEALLDEVRYDLGGRRVELVLRRGCDEKRREPRWPIHETVQVAPIRADGAIDWGSAYRALSRNLSEGGISLLQTRLASTPRVLIGLDWEGDVLYVPAEVRHCERLGSGMVQFGCQFETGPGLLRHGSDVLPEDVDAAIVALVNQQDGEVLPYHERRLHQRVVYTARIAVSGGTGPTVGFARNLSKGGISFLVHQPMPLEHRVLTLPAQQGPPLRVRARILRCVPLMDGVFEVGALFEGMAE